MALLAGQRISVLRAACQWWKDTASRDGHIRTSRQFLARLWEFVRESMPSRRRQRYGDVDYDWEYRVDTTSAAVGWRERLLGVFHSPYQPTEAALFHEMLNALSQQAQIDFSDFIFIDLGSGKGRTLLMASDYPFRRIMGVELLPALHQIAQQNLRPHHNRSQRCFLLESVCGDARDFVFPAESTVLFLFNPLTETGLRQVMTNLEKSLQAHPRVTYVLYHNPLLEHVLKESVALKRVGGTHQYSIYGFAVRISNCQIWRSCGDSVCSTHASRGRSVRALQARSLPIDSGYKISRDQAI